MSSNSELLRRAEIAKYALIGTSGVLGTYYVMKGAIGDDTPDPTPEQEWGPNSDWEQLLTLAIGGSVVVYLLATLPEMFSQMQSELQSLEKYIP